MITSTRRRRRRLAPAALAAALALVAASCDLVDPPHLLEEGHVDGFAVEVEGDELHVHIHDDSGPESVDRDPAATVLHARPASRTQVPPIPAFDFLGPDGSDIWVLPQIQDPDLLWLGWATEEIGPGVLQGNALTWHLLDVAGPGEMQIFTNGPFGDPHIVFNSADGLPDSTVVPTGAHVHGNWVFNAPGEYTVTFEATATLADGTPVSSGPVPYRFAIDSWSCVDIDGMALASSAAPGAQAALAFDLENCGTSDLHTHPVATFTQVPAGCPAPAAVDLGHFDLEGGELAPVDTTLTAPTCPGTYRVKVKGSGAANSYAQALDLVVT